MTGDDLARERSSLALVGRLSEFEYLRSSLAAQPGLHPIVADPFSGTTGLVRQAIADVDSRSVYVDARVVSGQLELGLAIAETVVATRHPEALAWWRGTAPSADVGGLRLWRSIRARGLDLGLLSLGRGSAAEVLGEALRFAAGDANSETVVIDHLDDLLRHSRADRSDPLSTMRTARQRDPALQLVLVGRPDGRLDTALKDPDHAMYRAGQVQRIARASADRFVDDLAVARPWLPDGINAAIVGALAELTAGVPAHLWGVVGLLTERMAPPVEAWERYREARAAETVRLAATVGGLHSLGMDVLTAIALGVGAYALPVNDGRIRAALHVLRDNGVVWQPRPRDWSIADPLLASWLRHHGQTSIKRRASAAPTV